MSQNRKILLLAIAVVAVVAGVLVVLAAKPPVAAVAPVDADRPGTTQPATTSTDGGRSRESEAINTYSDWVAANLDLAANAAGVRLEGGILVIQWKGQPPEELRQLLESKGVSVTWQDVPYSAADIAQAGRQLTDTGTLPDGAILQPEDNYTGIVVVLPAGLTSADSELDSRATEVPVRVVEGDQVISQTPGSSG
jgi:hypothetical protein